MRCITWRGQRRADTESIDGRSLRYQLLNSVLIQVAGRKYFDILPSYAIQFSADPAAVFRQVTAIQSNTRRLTSHVEDCLQRRADIVGVEKKNGVRRKGVQEVTKGFSLIF